MSYYQSFLSEIDDSKPMKGGATDPPEDEQEESYRDFLDESDPRGLRDPVSSKALSFSSVDAPPESLDNIGLALRSLDAPVEAKATEPATRYSDDEEYAERERNIARFIQSSYQPTSPRSSPATYSRKSTLLIFAMGFGVGAIAMMAVIFSNPIGFSQTDVTYTDNNYVQQPEEAVQQQPEETNVDHIAYTQDEKVRTEEAEEKLNKELGLDHFCGSCKWQKTSFTCDGRVDFLVHRYGMTVIEARESILDVCEKPEGRDLV